MISIIVATSKNRVIGMNNKIPWHLPLDFKYFKEKTSGSSIIMGRKTFDSIGKPLPNRDNIIITRNKDLKIDGCIIVNSLEDAIKVAKSEEIFIIGGSEIYNTSLSIADKIYLTLVHDTFEGDAFFPELSAEWIKVNRKDNPIDDKHKYKYSFIEYEKCKF